MSEDLHRALLDRIRAEGPISFAAYMEAALYHPRHGYYAAGRARTGWEGHYLTSPEIDPAFGGLWAHAVLQVWSSAGRPEGFTVIEVGPGEAGFSASLIEALSATEAWGAVRVVLVERDRRTAQRQRERLPEDAYLSWCDSIQAAHAESGFVIAHEVLDNIPVHIVGSNHGELRELLVGENGGRLVLVPTPLAPQLRPHVEHMEIVDGARAEVSPGRDDFVRSCAAAVEQGAVAFIDYGLDGRGWPAHPGGTVICYSASGVDDAPLDDPGDKDITSHVDWVAVASALESADHRALGPFGQAQILRTLGLVEIDRSLRAEHEAAVETGRGADALRALSRRQALSTLVDPSGLGGMQIMFGLRGIDVPAFLQE